MIIGELPGIPELDYLLLMESLRKYSRPRDKVSNLLKSSSLIRVKKGLYVRNDRRDPYSREVLANLIFGPSYVSLEYALQYHGLIPEAVVLVTSVTTLKNKGFQTPIGDFEYRHLPERFFSPGIEWRPVDTRRGFLIASPEKALWDTLYLRTPHLQADQVESHLFENMRIDETEFHRLDFGRLETLFRECNRQAIRGLRSVAHGRRDHG